MSTSSATVYPPLEEQPDLEIMVPAGPLLYMLGECGIGPDFRLWVTDSVAPAQADQAPPNAEIFWYWSRVETQPRSHVICSIRDVAVALAVQQGIGPLDLFAAAPAQTYTVRLPRTIAPRETALFMDWLPKEAQP